MPWRLGRAGQGRVGGEHWKRVLRMCFEEEFSGRSACLEQKLRNSDAEL